MVASMRSRPYRVLIGKPGLDGHNRGVHVLVRGLRDAGFEVVLLGRHQVIDDVVSIALDEDVEVVGVSLLSGAHTTLVPDLVRALRAAGSDAVVVVGGVIPDDDVAELERHGVAAVFGPGTSSDHIVSTVARLVGASSDVAG